VKQGAPERDYSGRDVVDKLGVRAGQAVALDERAWELDGDLRGRILSRAHRPPASGGEPLDLVLVSVADTTDVVEVLRRWRVTLKPAGAIWLLSPKRGRPGYVDQRHLIAAGAEAGLVDNKSCSVSDAISAMRFVIRRRDRQSGP